MSRKLKKGMTLVELLVVLVILASLAVTVSVSSSGMIDRAHVEKARRQGDAMRSALTRDEGLNLACDMGRLPNPAQPGELALLASRVFRSDVQHREGDYGPLDKDTAGDGNLRFAPLYRSYSMLELKNSITNNPAEYAQLTAFMGMASVSNLWRNTSVGGGWRGPYCTACPQDSENQQMTDPFGGLWDFAEDGSMRTIVSYGFDQLADTDAYAETNDWRAADLRFPVCPTNDTATLHVRLEWTEEVSSTGTVFVCCLAPRLNMDHETDSEGICKMTPAAFHCKTAASGSDGVSIDGLSPGNWGVFVGVTDGASRYSAPIRVVSLQFGQKTVQFKLSRCQPYNIR